jgi:hypothetical protein
MVVPPAKVAEVIAEEAALQRRMKTAIEAVVVGNVAVRVVAAIIVAAVEVTAVIVAMAVVATIFVIAIVVAVEVAPIVMAAVVAPIITAVVVTAPVVARIVPAVMIAMTRIIVAAGSVIDALAESIPVVGARDGSECPQRANRRQQPKAYGGLHDKPPRQPSLPKSEFFAKLGQNLTLQH